MVANTEKSLSHEFRKKLVAYSIKLAAQSTYQDVLNRVTEIGFKVKLFKVLEDKSVVEIVYPEDLQVLPGFIEKHSVIIQPNDAELTGFKRMQGRILICVSHMHGISKALRQIALNDLCEV